MASVLSISKFQNLVQKDRRAAKETDAVLFGKKIGLIAKLFGCWHENLSRPFTRGKTSYRSCLECGARKPFNAETLETYGNFYAPPPVE
ncbi:MAG TPA: hypothetical protein VIL74_05120 [Pyrinomonadaceae bacterium]|jgi:hypothetical protein